MNNKSQSPTTDEISQMMRVISVASKEEINRKNEELITEIREDHQDFIKNFEKGTCYLCEKSLTSLDGPVCVHWLLCPLGIKKKLIQKVFENAEFSQIDAYLRWVANTERPRMKNINDLKEEAQENTLIHTTISYKNLEWSLMCTKSDFQGHATKADGRFPHYHFSVIKEGKIMHKYGDRHIRLSEYDKFVVNAKIGEIPNLRWSDGPGSGMQTLMDQDKETLLKGMKSTADENHSSFHLTTMITADPGTTISGDEIYKMNEERKRTGKPLALLAKSIKNAKVVVIVEPSDGVPKMKNNPAPRKKSHKKQ